MATEGDTQVLDTLEVEKERGITVKANTATLLYPFRQNTYVLNLIDTPGHVDFSFEVNRSVNACDGALLLVDASQGIEAQTLANYRMVKNAGLAVIPVLTKLDIPHANPELIKEQLFYVLEFDPDTVLETSAKANIGIDRVFQAIIDRIPAPKEAAGAGAVQARAQLLDSWFDSHRGAVCLVKVFDGALRRGQKVHCVHSGRSYDIVELGVLTPQQVPLAELRAGQVGYLMAGIKSCREVTLGDTLYTGDAGKFDVGQALPTFHRKHSAVFASIYPCDSDSFTSLQAAMEKLLLNDASVRSSLETSDVLGMGYTCGFNGVLHMEVFCDRLQKEFGVDVIITAPTVPYLITLNQFAGADRAGKTVEIRSPKDFPVPFMLDKIQEPMVRASIIVAQDLIGPINELCQDHRGVQISSQYLSDTQLMLEYLLPLTEVVTSFYSRIKSMSSGHATVDFADAGYQESDLVKLDILINGKPVDALSLICARKKSMDLGRRLVERLRTVIDRQQFEVVIQAAIGAKILARERLAPFRKDVLTKSGKTVGGGDWTRKEKLLAAQREGKKRMKQVGNVSLSQEAFLSVLKV